MRSGFLGCFGVLFVLFLLGSCLMWFGTGVAPWAVVDEEDMIAALEDKPEQYDRLMALFQADSARFSEISAEPEALYVRPWPLHVASPSPAEQVLDSARLQEYRDLFQDLDLKGASLSWSEEGGVRLRTFVMGHQTATTWVRGYLWNPSPNSLTQVPSVDALADPENCREYARHVRGKWYVFYFQCD